MIAEIGHFCPHFIFSDGGTAFCTAAMGRIKQ